ncbi:hypothetical protein [Micromonospora sp. NPDC057141]|uniref:hypothetical protein n=1 Tax=Micromonospora sp. NPDC057141 TaxID=3346033 RepID=UPI00362DB1B6
MCPPRSWRLVSTLASLTLIVSACSSTSPQSASSSHSDSPGSDGGASADVSYAPPTTAAVGSYQAEDKLCPLLDQSRLREAFGKVTIAQDQIRTMSGAQVMSCTLTAGHFADGLVVSAIAEVGSTGSGREMFENLRQVQMGDGPIVDIEGTGAAAYTYVDDLTGTHLVTYDGNLYLTLAAVPLEPTATVPNDVIDHLTRLADSVLSGLRR